MYEVDFAIKDADSADLTYSFGCYGNPQKVSKEQFASETVEK